MSRPVWCKAPAPPPQGPKPIPEFQAALGIKPEPPPPNLTPKYVYLDHVGQVGVTSSTVYTDLSSPGPSVEAPVHPEGEVRISLYAEIEGSGIVSLDLEGANTVGTETIGLLLGPTAEEREFTFWLGGLQAGATTFTMKYAVVQGDEASFRERCLRVITGGMIREEDARALGYL